LDALPDGIEAFLRDNHVVSVATCARGQIWAASCFYAFEPATVSLILLSSQDTRHGQAMLASPQIAGTIAGQPESVLQIKGIQFSGHAHLLEGEEATQAYRLYCHRHPIARLKRSDVWQLILDEVKHTDNAKIFASKTFWRRQN